MTKIKSFIHEINSFSPIKTLIFNFHYFGIKGISFPVIIGKRFKLQTLKGAVTLPPVLPNRIHLGIDDFGWMTSTGYWINEGNVHFEGNCYIGNGTRIQVFQMPTFI